MLNALYAPGNGNFDLRRTKNLRAVQILLGHTNTVRYLGIEVEDALEISEQTEL